MNPTKLEPPLLHHHLHPIGESHPSIPDHHNPPLDFSLPPLSEFDLFRDDDDEDSVSRTSSDADGLPPATKNNNDDVVVSSERTKTNPRPQIINPNPHISSQFYTFNMDSHSLMIQCILDRRLASPDEIRAATPEPVLASWKSVWKDRNEETAYLTAWKRIQDKLTVHKGQHGNEFLCFKSNSNNQFVSHINQWQDIVMSFHGDADLKHLGLKETLERIKQVWTVGAKFYGIPESYIRACVAACSVCCSESNGSGGLGSRRLKRRRFEYTESFDVPAKDVPNKLQQLAAEHKVVLCIRQKYIRYKPFMAEVKDYACHRAGEPASSSKKSRILKREPYASKRCGCGFRIRAIVPICNYSEKDKTFVYQEEGMAVFKLYAVHTGHEPGPLDGNARIMHRVVGHKGGFLMDQDFAYGTSDEGDNENFMGNDDVDLQHSVLQQVKELKHEVGLLEVKVSRIRPELLSSVSQELFDLLNKVRNVGDCGSKSGGLVLNNELVVWNGDQNTTDLIEDVNDSFQPTLGDVGSWDQISGDTSKPEKWLKCNGFDEKTVLDCEDSKVIKPVRNDDTDAHTLVGLQVDNFYPGNTKWYDDSTCGLDCGSNGFRHGEIV